MKLFNKNQPGRTAEITANAANIYVDGILVQVREYPEHGKDTASMVIADLEKDGYVFHPVP